MTLTLQLPACPTLLPAGLDPIQSLDLTQLDPDAVTHALAELKGTPACLLGSEQTPALVWLLAVQAFPDAQRLCFRNELQEWWDLTHQRTWLAEVTEAGPASVGAPTAQVPVIPAPPAPTPAQATGVQSQGNSWATVDDSELISKSFKFAAWGTDKPENRRQLDSIEEEAQRRVSHNTTLPKAIAKARLGGEYAARLATELTGKLGREGLSGDITAWLDQVATGYHPRVRRHLDICLAKWQERQQGLKQRHAGPREYTSSLTPVTLVDGYHPNSLRHLPAATDWRIYIDETGSLFDETADELALHDSKLGRLVALAIPAGVKLPALEQGFHATSAKARQVDQVLQTLLQARVGIFGFTVKDPAIHANRWIDHVQKLVRWVVLQLPLLPPQRARVAVRIEQNVGYKTGHSLRALEEVLESEFQRLDPARFAQLRLTLEFMDKDEALNGYVDAVAFTWGSPAAESADRLKKSALLGHCLLRPSDDQAMERLYLALNTDRKLPPADWFALCASAAQEPDTGLLTAFLKQLGERVRGQAVVWQGYLEEVRQRLRLKRFDLAEIGQALDWLEQWAPGSLALPLALHLALETARLAADNHRGHANIERVMTCFEMVEALRDEAPAEACEAILRMAVSTANTFEFDALLAAVEQWANEPVAVPGLLNHAKLHSTLGQLQAFLGHPDAALPHFDRALAAFGRLSDAAQAQKEIAQTTSYRLIAQMDAPGTDGPAMQAALLQHLQPRLKKHSAAEISRSLACSGQPDDKFWPYAHHLWLRALVASPEAFAEARQAYLELASHWQTGEDHPWGLIEAYRAWLLCDADQPQQAAEHMQAAISICAAEPHGPILLWMAEVLRTLAQALGLTLDESPSSAMRQQLQQCLPAAPHAALARFAEAGILDRPAILAALCECLPFNFH